jgi:hypothetical protein
MRAVRPPDARKLRRANGVLLLALALALLCAADLAAQQSKPGEYQVKAVYLYNFGKFVQWPGRTDTHAGEKTFAICVLGRDPFGATLDEIIQGESVEGRSIVAKRLDRVENGEDCRILYISDSEKDRLEKILDSLKAKPILTVSDLPNFSEQGGMIQFVLEGDKVRFEVNLGAVEKAKLSLSSQLLKVAVAVRPGQPNR